MKSSKDGELSLCNYPSWGHTSGQSDDVLEVQLQPGLQRRCLGAEKVMAGGPQWSE